MTLHSRIALGIALLCSAAGGFAQAYPTKPVRLVAPFPPGGGTDLLSRIIAAPMAESLGQPVIVDNRPGAGGATGAEIVARAEPDGHTLILVSGSYAATSAYRQTSFDPVNGIQPIILLGTTGLLMSVHASVPASSVKEFIALAKASPGKLNYGSVGVGSVNHLSHELFKLMAKVNIVHVPYKGAGPGLAALTAGEVQVGMFSLVPSMPHVRAGRLKAIGVTNAKRSPILPDVAPIADTVPGYIVNHWYGMWGPKGMPASVTLRWNKDVARLLNADDMKKQMRGEGLDTAGGPPDELRAQIKQAVEQWSKVIVEARIPRTE